LIVIFGLAINGTAGAWVSGLGICSRVCVVPDRDPAIT
jgi:hypothetical protein